MIYGTQPGWAHNSRREQWEWHDPRGVVRAMVTDEMIERIAVPGALARRLRSTLGSVPPPLASQDE